MGVEIRTFDEDVYDGTTGQVTDTVTSYQLGSEVNGVWIPFVTKQGSYIDALVERGQAAQQAGTQNQGTPVGGTGAPQASSVPQADQGQQGDTGAPQSPAVPTVDPSTQTQDQAATGDQTASQG